jgi:hypothetical protein
MAEASLTEAFSRNVTHVATPLRQRKRFQLQREELLARCTDLISEDNIMLHLAIRKTLSTNLEVLVSRHTTKHITYYLDDDAENDQILFSPAARRLFSRGASFAPTPRTGAPRPLLEDLDRLQFRILGQVIRHIMSLKPANELNIIEQHLSLQPIHNIPLYCKPTSVAAMRTKLTARRLCLQRAGLGEFVARVREAGLHLLHQINQFTATFDTSNPRTRALSNLTVAEQNVLKHVISRGDLVIANLDKKLGVVVYSKSRAAEAASKHLMSANFQEITDLPDVELKDKRKHIWDTILSDAARLFDTDVFPEDLRMALLSKVPSMNIKLNKIYVVFKLKAGPSRPIVPSFTSPTALASRWLHNQLMDFAVKIPINCMDSLTYAKELDSLQLPHNFKGLILGLDAIAMFPNIPLQDSMETVRLLLHEDTYLPQDTQHIILRVLEWVLTNNYIEHNGKIFRQINGAVMGAAISVVLSTIFVYKRIEQPVLRKWHAHILHYKRYVDDINVFMLVTPQQAQLFLADMNAQSPTMQFTMTTHKQQAAFLDLAINLEKDASGFTTIQYRIYRKPGNAMAYLLADSYHTPHTGPGMIKGEFIRYLVKSSKKEFFAEDALLLSQAFATRGYKAEEINTILKKVEWHQRDHFRLRAANSKINLPPAGCAIFSPKLDPCLLAACDKGLHVDLERLRNTSTSRMEPEEIRFFGKNLAGIFPHKGLIAFRGAAKLGQMF